MAARSRAIGLDRSDEAARKKLFEQNYLFFGAPVVVFLCMDRSLTPWSIHDLGILSQSIMLAARDMGVDSAVAYNFVIYPDILRAGLEIPESQSIIIGIALGYAEIDHPQNKFRSPRRPIEEFTRLVGF